MFDVENREGVGGGTRHEAGVGSGYVICETDGSRTRRADAGAPTITSLRLEFKLRVIRWMFWNPYPYGDSSR